MEKIYLVEDNRPRSNWIGIVLRNIPHSNKIADDIINALNNTIRDFGSKSFLKLTDIGKPTKIHGKICTVITVADIDLAEHLCREWNGKQAKDQKLKCHIHPYSSMYREGNHPMFPINKEGKEYEKKRV